MIVLHRPYNNSNTSVQCIIWLDEPLPARFPQLLLNELLALARPAGLGAIEAAARRHDALDLLLDQAVQNAGTDHRGERNWDLGFNFDYVAGYRIKAYFYEAGTTADPDDDDADPVYSQYPGIPMVTSIEFDAMYGEGALENAVRLALPTGTRPL